MVKKTAKRKSKKVSKKPVSKNKTQAKTNTSAKRTKPTKKPTANTTANNPLNNKQLKFVQEYALSGNATDAAVCAGYSARTATSTASRLLKNPKINQTLEELQQEAKAEFKVTREDIFKRYEQAFRLAAVSDAPAAMVSATTGMARLFGLDKYKVEHEGSQTFVINTGIPDGTEEET